MLRRPGSRHNGARYRQGGHQENRAFRNNTARQCHKNDYHEAQWQSALRIRAQQSRKNGQPHQPAGSNRSTHKKRRLRHTRVGHDESGVFLLRQIVPALHSKSGATVHSRHTQLPETEQRVPLVRAHSLPHSDSNAYIPVRPHGKIHFTPAHIHKRSRTGTAVVCKNRLPPLGTRRDRP